MAQWVKSLPAAQETQTWVQCLGREAPLEEEVAPTPVFLLEKCHGQRSLGAAVSGVAKSQTRLSGEMRVHTHGVCLNHMVLLAFSSVRWSS